MWIGKLEDVRKIEDLVLSSQNKHDKYSKTWFRWFEFKWMAEAQLLFFGDLDQGVVSAGRIHQPSPALMRL